MCEGWEEYRFKSGRKFLYKTVEIEPADRVARPGCAGDGQRALADAERVGADEGRTAIMTRPTLL